MMYEKYACCDICLMIGYGWIVGWTMLMVSIMLIVYNNDLLELVLLRIGMSKSIWYVNIFEFELLGWSGLEWWDSDFVYCGKVSVCELRRLDVEIDIFLIDFKEKGWKWHVLIDFEKSWKWLICKWHFVVFMKNMVFGHTLVGHNLDYGSPFYAKPI